MNTNSSQTEEPALEPEEIEGVVMVTITPDKISTITDQGVLVDKEYLARSYPIATGKAYKVPVYRVKVTGSARPGEERWFSALRFLPSKRSSGEAVFMSGLADAQQYLTPTFDPEYNPHNTPGMDDGAFCLYDNFLVHAGPDTVDENDYGIGGLGCVAVVKFVQFMASIAYMCGKHPSDLPKNTMSYLCKRDRVQIFIEQATKPPVVEIDPPLHLTHKFQ